MLILFLVYKITIFFKTVVLWKWEGIGMSIIDNIKDVANVVRKADNIDLYRQILDLQQEALELVEENYELKGKLREIRKSTELHEKLTFESNSYFIKDEHKKDGPYCATCWDYEDKLVRMYEYGDNMGHYCNVCHIKKKQRRS